MTKLWQRRAPIVSNESGNGLGGFIDAPSGDSFFKKVGAISSGAIVGQAIVVLSSPILTRLYTPDDFGIFAIYSSLLGLLLVIGSLKYELAIPLPKREEGAIHLVVLCLLVLVATTVISAASALAASRWAGHWEPVARMSPYLWFVPFGLLGAGIYQILNYWAIRHGEYKRIGRTIFWKGMTQAGTQIGLGLAGMNASGLLAGDVAGRSAGSFSLARKRLVKYTNTSRSVRLHDLKAAAVRYRRFPLFSAGSSLLNAGGSQLPPLIFAGLYGVKQAGWLALSQRIIAIPMYLIGQAVAHVYFGEASRLAKDDPGAVRLLFVHASGRLAAAAVVPVALLALGGPLAFAAIFGQQWREAGVFVQILAVMFVGQFIAVPLSQTLNILERQDWQLIWDSSRLVVVTGGVIAAYHLEFDARAAIATYSATMFAAYVALFFLAFRATGPDRSDAVV